MLEYCFDKLEREFSMCWLILAKNHIFCLKACSFTIGLLFMLNLCFIKLECEISTCWSILAKSHVICLKTCNFMFGFPGRAQDDPKTPKTRPWHSQDAPKTCLRRLRDGSWGKIVQVRPRNAKTLKKPMDNHVFSFPKTCPRRPPRRPPKTAPRRFKTLTRRSKALQRRFQDVLRRLQDGPRSSQDGPRYFKIKPRGASGASERAQQVFQNCPTFLWLFTLDVSSTRL